MTHSNIYKRVHVPLVAKSQSSWILLAIALVVGPELRPLPTSLPLKEDLPQIKSLCLIICATCKRC